MNNRINIPIIILAGGQGSRLRPSLPETPKILAPIGTSCFLMILLEWLESQKAKHVTFSLGYRSEQIISKLTNVKSKFSYSIDWVTESTPLGTLGGLSMTLREKNIHEAIVLNGDTFTEINLFQFMRIMKQKLAFAGIAAKHKENTSRYGRLQLCETGFLSSFDEKNTKNTEPGWINSGIYYLSQEAIQAIKNESKGNIEESFFYHNVDKLVYFKLNKGIFIDIGTPDSYTKANIVLKDFIL